MAEEDPWDIDRYCEYTTAFQVHGSDGLITIHCHSEKFTVNTKILSMHSDYFKAVHANHTRRFLGVETPGPLEVRLDAVDFDTLGIYLYFAHRQALETGPANRTSPFFEEGDNTYERNATPLQLLRLFNLCALVENRSMGSFLEDHILDILEKWRGRYQHRSLRFCFRAFSEAFEYCAAHKGLKKMFLDAIVREFCAGLRGSEYQDNLEVIRHNHEFVAEISAVFADFLLFP